MQGVKGSSEREESNGMRRRQLGLLTTALVLAAVLAVSAGSAVAATQSRADAAAPNGPSAQIEVSPSQPPAAAGRDDSAFDGSPLGAPLTFGLTVLAVVLLVYAPRRARRALLSRRAST